MVLLGVEGAERPIPLPVEQADAVPVEHVHHVRVVRGRRRHRRRRADLRPAEELHPSLIPITDFDSFKRFGKLAKLKTPIELVQLFRD